MAQWPRPRLRAHKAALEPTPASARGSGADERRSDRSRKVAPNHADARRRTKIDREIELAGRATARRQSLAAKTLDADANRRGQCRCPSPNEDSHAERRVRIRSSRLSCSPDTGIPNTSSVVTSPADEHTTTFTVSQAATPESVRSRLHHFAGAGYHAAATQNRHSSGQGAADDDSKSTSVFRLAP